MKSVKFVILFLTACAVNIQQICSLTVDTMGEFRSRINLTEPRWPSYSSGILKSHSGAFYEPNINKTLILSAPNGYSVFAAVRLLDLRPNKEDTLTLFANGTKGPVTYSNTLFYQKRFFDILENKKTFYAPDGQLEVTFYTGSSIFSTETKGFDGFEILYTVQANWTKCSLDDFRCRNGRCISRSFQCDGHNHCGDRSDQDNCFYPEPKSSTRGSVAGIVTGVVFLLIAIACAIYISIRRASRMKIARTTIINQHPPPPSAPDCLPPYSERDTFYPPPPPPYTPYNQGIKNPGYQ